MTVWFPIILNTIKYIEFIEFIVLMINIINHFKNDTKLNLLK